MIDPREMKWIAEPELYILSSDKVIMETKPFTDLNTQGSSAEALQLTMHVEDTFCFTVRSEFRFRNKFDQCGIMIYNGSERKAMCGIIKHDDNVNQLACIVYHGGQGDLSCRDIGSVIDSIYYRMWYRNGDVRMQYSYGGRVYSDFRHFRLHTDDVIGIGIFACSPGNSWFDCTFSEMTLEENNQGE